MSKATPKERTIYVQGDRPDTNSLRRVGGSNSDRFNNRLLVDLIRTQYERSGMTDDDHGAQAEFALLGMAAFKPADEIEGLITTQALAMHNMVMELSRRAMLSEQPSDVAHGMRKAAVGASRQFTELLTALDRKRGKGGQQKVTVEHVHVHAGGQAIVGNIEPGVAGGGGNTGSDAEPHAPRAGLAHDATAGAVLPPVRSKDTERRPLPIASDAERPVPAARRRQHRPPHR
jgi:hypothetical protein